jgi:hypothetical protein
MSLQRLVTRGLFSDNWPKLPDERREAVIRGRFDLSPTGFTWGHMTLRWDLWRTAAGATARYDTVYGKLRMYDGEEFYSDVRDFGTITTAYLAIEYDKYADGVGDGTVEFRGSDTLFAWDSSLPSWETYMEPVSKYWRYIQLRLSKT